MNKLYTYMKTFISLFVSFRLAVSDIFGSCSIKAKSLKPNLPTRLEPSKADNSSSTSPYSSAIFK
jgi:hypothetical protein